MTKFGWSQYAPGMLASVGPIHAGKTPELGRLYNGIMTLTLPDGGHRTFKIATGYDGTIWAGKRVVSILVGPDNAGDGDYEKVAFLTADGIKPFKRIMGTQDHAGKIPKWLDVLWRMAGGEQIEGYTVHESRHCLRCNRRLTTPRAVLMGLGSECEKKT
jgi:hypothetical protein